MLTKDQKKSRLDIFKYLPSLCEDDPEELMRRVTQDDTLVHHFDPEAKKNSMQHPLLRNLRVSSVGKAMTSIFWDIQCVFSVVYLTGKSHDKWCILCRTT